MEKLINVESNMFSKYSSDFDAIKYKLSCGKSLTFQEKIKYKMRNFLLPSYVKHDDIQLLSQVCDYNCIICDDTSRIFDEIKYEKCTYCYECKYTHFVHFKMFVMCTKCINVC